VLKRGQHSGHGREQARGRPRQHLARESSFDTPAPNRL
jgi:hypothetical protein